MIFQVVIVVPTCHRNEGEFPEGAKWGAARLPPQALPLISGPFSSAFASTKNNSAGKTIWYTTELPSDLLHPPKLDGNVEIGTLFLHTNSQTSKKQIWVWDNEWKIVPQNDSNRFCHPGREISDRFFRLLKSGNPSWVTDASLSRYTRNGSVSGNG